MRFVAPAGTPLRLREIFAGLLQGLVSGNSLQQLDQQLKISSATNFCWSFSSGRAAMVVALRAMKRAGSPRKSKVIIPGYTCYSVAAAIERAGLQPLLCDIDPRTLSLDLQQLSQFDFSDVLAIITANLYGIPNDTAVIERIAQEQGVFLLDDAAQSFGASMQGRPTGSFGHVGLFSFDKGKNIPTIQGGVLVARDNALIDSLQFEWDRIPVAGLSDTLQSAIKLIPYSILLKPHWYGLVRSIPGLGLGQTRYELEYPITRYSKVLAGLATRLATQVGTINAKRIENASKLRAALSGIGSLQIVEPPAGAAPVYLRLPVLVPPARRAELITALERVGVGATASYPLALRDVPNVRARLSDNALDTPRAREVAQRIVTLPTHAYCPENMAHTVRNICLQVLA